MTDIWTIGHSTRDLQTFVAIVASFKIDVLEDVRRFPHSRRQPHFNTDELKKALFAAGIKYHYLGDALGGFRPKQKDSKHTALTNSSFQGYAEHMETPMFQKAFDHLVEAAATKRVAYMCSESNYKSCHRRMISDAMHLLANATVHHIVDVGRELAHEPIREARVEDGKLVYAERPLSSFDST
jgi:uncharacterized protein (DUF488 family)